MHPWRRCLYDEHHWFIAEDSQSVWLNNHASQKFQTHSSNQRTVADWSLRTNHCVLLSLLYFQCESRCFLSLHQRSPKSCSHPQLVVCTFEKHGVPLLHVPCQLPCTASKKASPASGGQGPSFYSAFWSFLLLFFLGSKGNLSVQAI